MTGVLITRADEDSYMQRDDHVKIQGYDGHLQAMRIGLRRINSDNTFILNFQPQNCDNICCFSSLGYWFIMATLEN